MKLQARKLHIKETLLSYFSEYTLEIFEWTLNQGNHPLGFVNIMCSNFVSAKSQQNSLFARNEKMIKER